MSPCVSASLSLPLWRGQRGEPLCFTCSAASYFSTLLLFQTAHQISVKCKHVEGRARGWQGDWWRAAERPSVYVCVCCVCWLGPWVGSLSTSSPPPSVSYSPRNLPARCGTTPLATPNSTTSLRWSTLTQRRLHFHFTWHSRAVNIVADEERRSLAYFSVLAWKQK